MSSSFTFCPVAVGRAPAGRHHTGRAGFLRPLLILLGLLAGVASTLRAEDGYELWLRYHPISDAARLTEYRAAISQLVIDRQSPSPTIDAARDELTRGLRGLLGREIPTAPAVARDGVIVLGTPAGSKLMASLGLGDELEEVGDEGFVIRETMLGRRRAIVIAANQDVGVLYGAFHLLRHLQTHRPLAGLSVVSAPKVQLRLLNHWDNLDRTMDRGYAGFSIWDWHKLPDYLYPRYTDYARANASAGINGTVLTNVNSNAAGSAGLRAIARGRCQHARRRTGSARRGRDVAGFRLQRWSARGSGPAGVRRVQAPGREVPG